MSPRKMKKDISGVENSGGYAFAEDEQRSVQVLWFLIAWLSILLSVGLLFII